MYTVNDCNSWYLMTELLLINFPQTTTLSYNSNSLQPLAVHSHWLLCVQPNYSWKRNTAKSCTEYSQFICSVGWSPEAALADVHHCSKFFQSDVRATETLKIESSDQPGWSLSIYNLFERLSWQMVLFSLWWTTPSTDPLLTNCNIPPSFYQLYTFRASKSVLLALPRLKVLLMYSLWHEIQCISTKFWHYFPKFDFHKTYIGKISMLQGFLKCIALNTSK